MADDPAQEHNRTERLAQLGSLLAGFAHEIRNPLSTIGLNIQLVKEDFAEAQTPRDKRTFKRLSVVEAEIQRLQKILEDFLRYVRRPKLAVRAVDLNRRLRDLVELNAPEFARGGVSLRMYAGSDIGEVHLDMDLFHSVIVNLLVNAQAACKAGDEVMLATRREAGEVVVQVTDTGAGMTADVLERAFEPYFSTKKSGTGLGLAIARRIVEEHGGTMTVSSEPGRGTQFTMRLPLRPRAAAEGETES